MNWKTFAQGLAAAAIGGAAGGATQAVTTTNKVGLGTLICADVGALSTTLAYLLQSPLTRTQAQQVAATGAVSDPAAAPPAAVTEQKQ